MLNILKRVHEQHERSSSNKFENYKKLWLDFPDNEERQIRLVPTLLEVHTHWIGPGKGSQRGFCVPDAFKGKGAIPFVFNCLDWDIDADAVTGEQTCLVCALAAVAREARRNESDFEQKKALGALIGESLPRTYMKQLAIDRADPFIVLVTPDGKEERVEGFKIASFGMEALEDIYGVCKQTARDISDPDVGVDIAVTKTIAQRTTYSVQAVVRGVEVAVTPLTAAERAYHQHDLKRICVRLTDPAKVLAAMLPDYRQMYEMALEQGLVKPFKPFAPTPVKPSTPVNLTSKPEAEAPKSTVNVASMKQSAAATKPAATKTAPAKTTAPTASKGAPKTVTQTAPTSAPKVEEKSEFDEFDTAEDDTSDAVEEFDGDAANAEETETPAAEEGSNKNPAENWPCFGQIEPDHQECQGCESRKACAKKAGVTLK